MTGHQTPHEAWLAKWRIYELKLMNYELRREIRHLAAVMDRVREAECPRIPLTVSESPHRDRGTPVARLVVCSPRTESTLPMRGKGKEPGTGLVRATKRDLGLEDR